MTGRYTTNHFTMKGSMHAHGCSLEGKRTPANLTQLPPLGCSVTVSKGRFTAMRL